MKLIVGIVALGFILNYVLSGGRRGAAKAPNTVKGAFWGAVGGFTSFVSHAGGPPMQMYLLPLRLDSKVLAGTTVLVFAVANLVKLLPYTTLGQFSAAHLTASLVLLPLAPIATWFGVRLVRTIRPETFYRVTYTLLFLVAVKLLHDGLTGIL